MTVELLLAGAGACVLGVLLGMLGGGGGILAVPLLVYAVGVGPQSAIAISLFVVGGTSALGAALAAARGRVRARLGALFGAGSMLGAFTGGKLAHHLPERALLIGLAVMMVTTALAMLRGRSTAAMGRALAPARVLGIAAAVGLVSGLVGAGGGFLLVPALTLLAGLALRDAIGTSLFIIAMQSFAGFGGHLGHVDLPWLLLATMTIPSVVGMLIGTALAAHVATVALKRGFAGLVLAIGVFLLLRQLPLALALPVAVLVFGLAWRFARLTPHSNEITGSCTNSRPTRP